MDKYKFKENFVQAIEGLDPDIVHLETVIKDLPQWDSLAVLTTIAMVDAEYNVTVTANDLVQCHTLYDLFVWVQQKSDKP